jgi:hypothetical protein
MNSHNTRPDFVHYKTPVRDDSAVEEARVISTKLIKDVNLTIEHDVDDGCDPYNSTGQHVVLKQRKLPKD